jgi:valyl-tRNA synthetase
MAGLVDADKEARRLEKQREALAKDVEGLERRLAAPGFAGEAPLGCLYALCLYVLGVFFICFL